MILILVNHTQMVTKYRRYKQTHTHTHKNSYFLVVTMSVGLSQTRSNYYDTKCTLNYHHAIVTGENVMDKPTEHWEELEQYCRENLHNALLRSKG